MSTNTRCDTDGCSQLTVAKCIHCNNHLCLKCLTRHQQPIDLQISQLTNDMNRLLAISCVTDEHHRDDNNNNDDDDDDDLSTHHPQINASKQYKSIIEQIDRWEMIMTKRLNGLVTQARNAARTSFEQISFEIEEWSTERQIEIQQLTDEIEQLSSNDSNELSMRLKIDQYQREVQKYIQEYETAHVELSLINMDSVPISPTTFQVYSLFEHSICFDLSLIRDPPNACFDASKSSSSLSIASSALSPTSAANRREKIFLPSVLVSSQDRILLFSNRAKLLNIFSILGTLIDQFTWNHGDIVDICYDYSSSSNNIDTFFVLSSNGSVYSLEYDSDQHTYSWLSMISVNNQTYYTQIICDAKLSYLYLFMPSKHRLDQWTINKTKRNIIQCTNQLIITNDHVEHLCTSHNQLALLLKDKRKPLNSRIELRHFTDLLVTICSITLDRLSKPLRLIFDNRHGFILAHGNQLCSFGSDGDIVHKRVFDDIQEIKRVTFCQRSTIAILTENDQLLFYLLTK